MCFLYGEFEDILCLKAYLQHSLNFEIGYIFTKIRSYLSYILRLLGDYSDSDRDDKLRAFFAHVIERLGNIQRCIMILRWDLILLFALSLSLFRLDIRTRLIMNFMTPFDIHIMRLLWINCFSEYHHMIS